MIPVDWMKWALLYWDKISSIVPSSFDISRDSGDKERYSSMQYLMDQDIYSAIPPENVFRKSDPTDFENIFIQSMESAVQPPLEETSMKWEIYRCKLTDNVFDYLKDKNLILSGQYLDSSVIVSTFTAVLYMGLLASHLAANDRNPTITNTNSDIYQDIVYRAPDKSAGFESYQVQLMNILPVPASNVNLQDIIDFKNERKDELFHFREEIDSFIRKISTAKSYEEFKLLSIQFEEKIERETNNLKRLLNESKIQYFLADLGSLITPTISKIDSIWESPLSDPIKAATLGGSIIKVASILVKNHNQKNAILRDNPFAYIYQANQHSIIR